MLIVLGQYFGTSEIHSYFLRPEKVHLGFFALRALQFWEMALVFHYYLGKFGINIFPDLKGKEIKYKKTKFAHFFAILTKIKFTLTKIHFLKH